MIVTLLCLFIYIPFFLISALNASGHFLVLSIEIPVSIDASLLCLNENTKNLNQLII